jgi:uncharacterized protein YndB with AHSA1/START domain
MPGRFANVIALVASAVCVCEPVTAAELEEVVVERVEDRYALRSETLFDASVEDLYRVLTDYDQFEKFTSAFTVSRNLAPDALGRPRFYNEMEGCVLFFCVTFQRYGYLELEPMGYIRAIVDPETSDFDYSVESWRLTPEGRRTRLVYQFEMEPSFWVPPVIGPFYIRRALRAGAVRAVNRIEALAQGREPERPVE